MTIERYKAGCKMRLILTVVFILSFSVPIFAANESVSTKQIPDVNTIDENANIVA